MDNRTGAKDREAHTRSKKRVFLVEIPGIPGLHTMSGSSIRDVESKVWHQYGVNPDLVQPKPLHEDKPKVRNPLQHKPFSGLSELLVQKEKTND